ncbi:Eukaryotic translation initiation factor 3 subunit L-like [Oopsacas minuta]|uniref:Eukaryotic translation initiation factor 3 subunit L-like n=1 Tax=Oopsacas minuta TaxID=111878 RepID=A0AAV7JSI6_9METZ|nr:Eukaryotic translation initiation factor 3 subunit L-like [Oopsacas minuta]
MTYSGVNRSTSGLTAEDNYYGEGQEAYQSELRQSSISPEVSEFLYNLLEQILFTTQEEVQDKQRKGELSRLYDNYFYLSDKYYQLYRWPTVEEVSRHLNIDSEIEGWQISIFRRLYSELFIRHSLELSESKAPAPFSYSDYCDSMDIYLGLFNLLLNECKEPLNFDLPSQWIWDIINGFLKHHESFLIWRSQVKKRSLKERQLLRDSDNLWTVELVLNALNTLIKFSNINEQLEAYHKTKDPEAAKEAGNKYGRQPLYRNLGYFSLFALLKLHTQLGDFHEGLLSVKNIRITHQTLTRMTIPLSAINLVYNMGFCYFMMRRYLDVIRVFSEITQLTQSWSLGQGSISGEQIMKIQVELIVNKCNKILAFITPLIPQNFDDKTTKSLSRITTLNEAISTFRLEELRDYFYQCCPQFLPTTTPDYDNLVDQSESCVEHQWEVFLSDYIPQMFIPRVRGYLKFYASLPLSKLAEFLASEYAEFSQEQVEKYMIPNDIERLRSFLMCYKHKMYSPVWMGDSPLEGMHRSANDLEFYLDGDMIHIVERKKRDQTYEESFVDEILKLRDLRSQIIKPNQSFHQAQY